MRKKEEIALWKVEDMIHYVAEFYKMDENSDDFLNGVRKGEDTDSPYAFRLSNSFRGYGVN